MPRGKVGKFKTPSLFTLCSLDNEFEVSNDELNGFIKRGQIIPVSQHRYAKVLEKSGFTKEKIRQLYLISTPDPKYSVRGTSEWINRRSLNDENGAQIKGGGLTSDEYEREKQNGLEFPFFPKGDRHVFGGITKREVAETYDKYAKLDSAWRKMHEIEPAFASALNAPLESPFAKPVAVFTPLSIPATNNGRTRRVEFEKLRQINPGRYGDLKILLVKGKSDGRRIYQIADRHQNYTLDDYRHLARVAKEYGLNFTAAHLTKEKNRRLLHEKMQDTLLSVYRAARGHAGLSISHPQNVFLDGKDFTGSIFFDTMGLTDASDKNKHFDVGILREFDAILADTLRLPLDNRRRIERHPMWQQATRN